MKKKIVFLIFLLLFLGSSFLVLNFVKAQDCGSDIDCQISQLKSKYDALFPAQQKNKQDLADLKKQLSDLDSSISNISDQLNNIEKQISGREADLAYAQEIFNQKARDQYIELRSSDPLILTFLSSDSATDAFREASYRKRAADEDRKTMEKYGVDLKNLKDDKNSLEKNQASLASLKSQVSDKEKFLASEVAKVDAYLAQLSAEQQNLIALKSGSFSVSVGDAALADDYNASLAGWTANASGGSVTIFSFGAYAGNGPNSQRNGMSQYGAWARAKSGQDYNAILQAYYGQAPIQRDMPAMINTDQGTIPFETQYLYGIAEMPSSWTDNNSAALKAQAIAARTYAYHYTQGGGTICTNDHCQVYSASKAANPPQAWKDAVDQTKGIILPDGVSAQYVSTPGGYLDTKGWDTTCGGGSCLAGGAWDAASPWFYKAWYTNYTYGSGFSSCQRSNPWLSQVDMSDILNAWTVYNGGTDDDRSHVLPPDGCGGGSPYSLSQMADRASAIGTRYSSVSTVSVQQSTNGFTSNITFYTDAGSVSIAGFDTSCSHSQKGCKDFWTIFNLRAPGNISIKSRMFDIKVK